jgi:hypothetical protein
MSDTKVQTNDDDYHAVLDGKDEKTQEQGAGVTDYVLMSSQVVLLLIWTFCCQYGEGV